MQYIQINSTNYWAEIDNENVIRTINKNNIEEQLLSINSQLEGKEAITDEKLLEWAKINYPNSQEMKDIRYLEQIKIELEDLLTKLI